jgi:abelson tyrosine-protein kinase 1
MLAETTPQKIFVHEVEIWKKLYHLNVLELLGASSMSGELPWFLVSPFLVVFSGLAVEPLT